jgi:D-alanyl-D-alanine carboxypeptidase
VKPSRAIAIVALASMGAPAAAEQDDDDSGAGSGSAIAAPKDRKLRATWLHERLDAAIAAHPTLAKAKLALVVVDLATGAELYARNADAALNLASNTKLLTSSASAR